MAGHKLSRQRVSFTEAMSNHTREYSLAEYGHSRRDAFNSLSLQLMDACDALPFNDVPVEDAIQYIGLAIFPLLFARVGVDGSYRLAYLHALRRQQSRCRQLLASPVPSLQQKAVIRHCLFDFVVCRVHLYDC